MRTHIPYVISCTHLPGLDSYDCALAYLVTLSRARPSGLLGSKLPLIADLSHAEPGAKAHGVVTGIQDYGVFVSFYGGVSGLAATAELGLAPGQKPAEAFSLGQVRHGGLLICIACVAMCIAYAALCSAVDNKCVAVL